ncbi:MAG TPA: hypothetical protein VGB89_01920, partial [Bacteroidota bacterium]
MTRNMFPYLILVLSALSSVGCNGTQTYGHLHQDIQLPSGKRFKVLDFEKQYSGTTPLTITLKYESDLPIENNAELRAQIREVWDVFKAEVDSLKFSRAVVTAQRSFSFLGFEYNKWWSYVFSKRNDDSWIID